jgi:hypothetical protein
MQKASEASVDAALSALHLLHRVEGQAAVLGAARRTAARNGNEKTRAVRLVAVLIRFDANAPDRAPPRFR